MNLTNTMLAAQYFTGVNNQTKTIKTVWFGRDLTAVGSAWLRGGLSPDLATIKGNYQWCF